MCGIAGFVALGNRSVKTEWITSMLTELYHRGPDENGVFVDGPLIFGHTRLSILDKLGGKQPMAIEEGRYVITYNGEIFNYIELKKDLEERGHRFLTNSDTEVVLRLYHEFGESCVNTMNGQWAFAIWDKLKQSLFLSRDRMGVRPLYYSVQNGYFAFASEVKAIFRLPFISRAIDPQALTQIFTFWHPQTPRSIFKDVSLLPPAHNMRFDLEKQQMTIKRYWQLAYNDTGARHCDAHEVAHELKTLLTDATRIRLRADVPVGSYLSGGLDSSAIAGLIHHKSDAALRTFSVSFEEKQFDESGFQWEVAKFLGTSHKSIHCRNDDIGRIFPSVIWHTEMPVLRTAPAPLFMLSRLVRDDGYKVVLTGEGADEVFGGYDIFKETKIRLFCAKYPQSKIRPLILKRLYPYMPQIQSQSLDYLKSFFNTADSATGDPYFSHQPRWNIGKQNHLFFSDEVRASLADGARHLEPDTELPPSFNDWDSLSRAQYIESTQLLPGYILSSQGDRMSMAHSIEGRFPFLDHRVVEFGAQISPLLKMNALDEKYILKLAMKDVVPAQVMNRKKQPYRAPDAQSFLGKGAHESAPWVSDQLSRDKLQRSGLFNPKTVGKLVEKGMRGSIASMKDNMALVGILSTQLVYEHFIHSLRRPEAHGD